MIYLNSLTTIFCIIIFVCAIFKTISHIKISREGNRLVILIMKNKKYLETKNDLSNHID